MPDTDPQVSTEQGERRPTDPTNALQHGPRVSVGRVVHYQDGVRTLAAFVSAVHEPSVVDLHVFAPPPSAPVVLRPSVPFNAAGVASTWRWPPRV